ncbi:hypothetical protein [Pseudorhodoplanes sinuspersici]|uniref:hypothetical protein n=1 Tax=Pseudorhodoplanes sinuspersici TaxID=1235591 RepID=UPI000FEE2BF0|nr:hypothetical protein [Pseudorhodoplanes sinuspersici]RKE70639.1 hypothetical protein DFP91_2880 [Pseudorhodoplanes sinuspersici]
MEFSIFSHGFRPHRVAGDSYDGDIREIVLAEELGFRDAYQRASRRTALYQ